MLGFFLLVDGRAPSFYPTVEVYASSATWGVVAAGPILAMAYVLGLFLSSAALVAVHAYVGLGVEEEAVDLARIGALSGTISVAVQYYAQLRQDRNTIGGCALALIVLAAGSASEISNLQHVKGSIAMLTLASLALAGTLFWLAARKTLEAHRLAHNIVESAPKAAAEGERVANSGMG